MPTAKVVRTTVVRDSTSTTSRFNQIWLWAILVACLALLFAIISVAASGWGGRHLLKNCNDCLGTTILAFLGILCLIFGIIFTILFAKRLITSFSIGIKVSGVLLLALAGIFIVAAYASIDPHNPNNYSYYLMITAGVFTFLASIIAAFWLGQNWGTV
jgi:predicted acyltransferase